MKKIIISLSVIAVVTVFVAGTTAAFFSDTERSRGNTLSAGEIDLGIDNESYYNGLFNPGTSWDMDFKIDDEPARLFFNFLDLKPGDWGEDTISIHVRDNDSWACMNVAFTEHNENDLNEPEAKDGDVTLDEGELQNEINFVWWADDGDNVLETDEQSQIFKNTRLSNMEDMKVALASSGQGGIFGNEPLVGGEATYYIGKAWCFGKMTLAPVPQDGDGKTGSNGPIQRGPGILCDGSDVDNTSQTDSVVGEVSFLAVQSRSNSDFKCEGGGLGCHEDLDLMLVLDRSGSISNAELTLLQTAAKAFVDTLDPNGAHIGQSSFSTTGTLDQHLTDDGALVKAAIDLLDNGGTTNLYEGLALASDDLDATSTDNFVGYDRDDSVAPDFMVIITDGQPNQPVSIAKAKALAKSEADYAKANGVEIFVVGVGTTLDTSVWLRDNIASGVDHYYDIADYSTLEDVLRLIAECGEGPLP